MERICYKCKKKLPLTSEYFYADKRKKDGFCYSCKKCSIKFTQQSKNKEKTNTNTRKLREDRLNKGLCKFCGVARLEYSSQFCEKHYLEHLSRQHLGTTTRWQELKQLLENQNYKCNYTGELLVLGLNASVDHKKAQNTHPELYRDINNLQWVTLEVNVMKRNLSEDKFLGIISSIYNNIYKNQL